MSKRIDFSQLGGLLFYQDTVEFMQEAYQNPIAALSKFLGEKYVAFGCVEAGGVVSDGVIVVNGELIPFTGGAVSAQIVITEVVEQEGYDDATTKDVFFTKTAGFGLAGGFPYADLKRLPFNASSVSDCVTNIARIVKSIIQFEPEVILEGCAVTDVTTGPNTCKVSAGLVLFNGTIITSPAYDGAYPCYLKEDGSWVTAAPGAGLYITFNPYTSQRYKNVLDRAVTPTGEIKMFKTLTDRFNAGVGRWEMKGYSLVTTLQSRTPVGLWFDGVPAANVTDANFAAAGNQGGEKNHTLTIGEMPSHNHSNGVYNRLLKMDSTETATASDGNNATGSEPTIMRSATIQAAGGGGAHNNMQPYTIVVYAERTA